MRQSAVFVAFLALVVVVPTAFAEDAPPAQFEQRLEDARLRLDLSDDQLALVRPILEKSRSEQQAIMASYGVDLENPGSPAEKLGLRKARAMRKELNAVQQATLAELDDVLTEAQLEDYKQMQDARRKEMRARMREGR